MAHASVASAAKRNEYRLRRVRYHGNPRFLRKFGSGARMAAKAERQHYWDAARAFLMLLGLPYHVAMLYHPGGWIVPAWHPSPALGWLAALIHLFRMPAFFVVAGYFAALLLARRDPSAWFRSRAIRLGVPLVVGLLLLVPILNLLVELVAYAPKGAVANWAYQASTSGGYWVRHLWFLIVLLYLNAGAAISTRAIPELQQWQLADHWDALAARYLPWILAGTAIVVGIWQAISIELFYKAGLATNIPQQILRIDDWLAALPYFLIGALLQRSPRLLEAFGRISPAILALGVIALVFGLAFEERGWPPLGRFAGAVAAVILTQILIASARRWLDRPNHIVAAFVRGAFVLYLFHLPILIGLYGVGGLDLLYPAAGFASILALTFALSWIAWLVIARVPILNLMFNGVAADRPLRSLRRPAYAE